MGALVEGLFPAAQKEHCGAQLFTANTDADKYSVNVWATDGKTGLSLCSQLVSVVYWQLSKGFAAA